MVINFTLFVSPLQEEMSRAGILFRLLPLLVHKEKGLSLHQKPASLVLFLETGQAKPVDESPAIVYYHRRMVPYFDSRHL